MVIFIAQAIGWGWSRLLRRPHNEAIAHRDLEHAHWDPVARRWFRHLGLAEDTVARAA